MRYLIRSPGGAEVSGWSITVAEVLLWTQEGLQTVGDALHLLHLRVLHLAKMEDPPICRRNLTETNICQWDAVHSRRGVMWARRDRDVIYHTGSCTERPHRGFKTPSEEFAQIPVVMQVLHGCFLLDRNKCLRQKSHDCNRPMTGPYLHVDPKRPDVQRVQGLPQPGGEFHLIDATPGPRDEAHGEGAIQRHLYGKKGKLIIILFYTINRKGKTEKAERERERDAGGGAILPVVMTTKK